MTISIWRYSHLTLAISSFIFILIAAVTGIILAFEPISNQLKPYAINTDKITLSETITSLKKEHKEIITINVNQHNFITASVINKSGVNETFYINPFTGKKIDNILQKHPIFKWTTNLHRSLFLKSTGRFLVGLFSFLLLLIAITGIIIISKRQGGFLKLFSKIVKENFNQYYHIIIGRYTLIPIIIITLTGVYLSLEKLSLLPENKIQHQYDFTSKSNSKLAIANFPIFNQIKLNELKSIEFPFTNDPEDYFFIKTNTKEILVHQYSGEIVSNQNLSWVKIISDWSLLLHTGRGTVIWSIILLLSCLSILFFIYSGFAMTVERIRKSSLPKNKFKKDKAEIIILLGSENGATISFGNSLYKSLIIANQSVFIDHLNNYTLYKNANHLLILTATYGEGEAPTNANNFLNLITDVKQKQNLSYSVIGFGSLAYSNFCQFAIDINTRLQENANFIQTLDVCKINQQSFSDFKNWGQQWGQKTNIKLELKQEVLKVKNQETFTVIYKTALNIDNSFLIRLKPTKNLQFSSGDLLSIRPKEDNVERLYSIGKIGNDILLSIKKHEFGVCSNLLLNLKETDILEARIQKNKEFHFSKKQKNTILIANGTGIAPFLGMLDSPIKTHLFWGGRTKESLKMYQPFLISLPLNNTHIAFSQEKHKKYVQDLILEEKKLIVNTLKNNGVIMICGSVAMMNGVLNNLEKIVSSELNTSLKKLKNNSQIKTDCY